MYDLAITGGLVVTPEGVQVADIAVRDGRIAMVGTVDRAAVSGRVIDASGQYVLPGAIDAHVHCQTWTDHADTIADSLRSAAHGGVTTALVQIRPRTDHSPAAAIEHFIAEGERSSAIDFGLHTIMRPEHDPATEVPKVIELGSPTIKFFMSYKDTGIMTSDAGLLRGLRVVAEAGGMAMVHAEDGEILSDLTAWARAQGRTALEDFAWTHPYYAEDLGVMKALTYARAVECPLYVLHMTTAGGVDLLARAAADGQRVWGETCPKYLTLTNDDLLRRGTVAKVGPPLRTDFDRERLWRALQDGVVSTVASDHAPRVRGDGPVTDVFAEPYGAPGVETLLPVVYDQLINKRGGDLELLARIVSTNPAKLFGLYPRKGVIQPGADADLVVIDPSQRRVIRAADQHTTANYSLYEGREVKGWPVLTTVRGRVVLDGQTLAATAGHGRYVPRRTQDLMAIDAA